MLTYTADNLEQLCHEVAETDSDLKAILHEYGHPPLWIRPNTFETLVLTILEQQVSLASAYAAYKRLKEKIRITPKNLLALSDEELRACSLTRQKIRYTRILAEAMLAKEVDLKKFEKMDDEAVRARLIQLKGIGNWTIDIYLLHALRRTDIFPIGDLALVNAIRMKKELPHATKEDLLKLSGRWQPYRSIATMIFWHYYIKKKNIKILH